VAVHDRTYMKEDEGWHPRTRFPVIVWIILAHVAGMLAHAAAAKWFRTPIEEWTVLTWGGLRAGRVWTVLTHAFYSPIESLSIWWLFFVGLVYYFGKLLQEWLGAERFLQFLVAALLSGGAVFAAAFATGAGQALGGDAAMGLNGIATACVLYGAFREPRHPIGIWFTQVPLWLFAVVWMFLDVATIFGLTSFGSPSLWVDLGAAAYAWAAWRWNLVPDVRAWRESMRRNRDRRVAASEAAERAAVQERVDALLDKISREGMASLSDAEREFLKRSSKRY
jgi:hypothetical protein